MDDATIEAREALLKLRQRDVYGTCHAEHHMVATEGGIVRVEACQRSHLLEARCRNWRPVGGRKKTAP